MLLRLLNWFRRERSRTHAHKAAWAEQLLPGPDGWSPFQRTCEATIFREISQLGLEISARREHRAGSPYIEAVIANTELVVWIHPDGADLTGPDVDLRLEHWDAESPEALLRRLGDAIRKAVRSSVTR